jgi:enterobacterial common antigen flippase
MSATGFGARTKSSCSTAAAASPLAEARDSYRQILRSSAVMGGATLFNVLVGIVRTKVLALLLGPAGVGLMGALSSLLDLCRAASDAGVTRSGVRQIADASTADPQRVGQVAFVLRRLTLLLGIAGACLLLLFSGPLTVMTFGDDRHSTAVQILAVALIFSLVADGNSALLQGMRRIDDLAKMGIVGSVLGAIASVSLILLYREHGVALALAAIAVISALLSWRFSKRAGVTLTRVAGSAFRPDAVSMLRLGLAFMFSSVVVVAASYAVRAMLLRAEGIESAGLFQSAWAIGGMYVGFILQSMSTDYYPRLVSVAHDDEACNRLVAEQSRIGILIAGPGVIATLAFAPLLVSLLYSPSFAQSADALRWVCMGMALRVFTWPIGFILIAKNKQKLFMAVDFAWAALNVGLSWLCITRFGLEGAGLAFCLSYVCHAAIVLPIAKSLTGYRMSGDHVRSIGFLVLLAAVTTVGARTLAPWAAYCIGAVALVASSVHSIHSLTALADPQSLPPSLRKLLVLLQRLRLSRATPLQ